MARSIWDNKDKDSGSMTYFCDSNNLSCHCRLQRLKGLGCTLRHVTRHIGAIEQAYLIPSDLMSLPPKHSIYVPQQLQIMYKKPGPSWVPLDGHPKPRVEFPRLQPVPLYAAGKRWKWDNLSPHQHVMVWRINSKLNHSLKNHEGYDTKSKTCTHDKTWPWFNSSPKAESISKIHNQNRNLGSWHSNNVLQLPFLKMQPQIKSITQSFTFVAFWHQKIGYTSQVLTHYSICFKSLQQNSLRNHKPSKARQFLPLQRQL